MRIADIVEKMRELAEERPTFVYANQEGYEGTCGYVGSKAGTMDGVGCIVGQALVQNGVSADELLMMERSREAMPTAMQLLAIVWGDRFGGVEEAMEDGSIKWITMVQEAQDTGATWHDAVKRADSKVKTGVSV